jgi:hypothetical protein
VDRRGRCSVLAAEKVLSTTPMLVEPKEREPLLLYIAATHQVVSTVLLFERSEEGKAHGVQRPVYFLSEVLSPSKQRYPHYKKLYISLSTASSKFNSQRFKNPKIANKYILESLEYFLAYGSGLNPFIIIYFL